MCLDTFHYMAWHIITLSLQAALTDRILYSHGRMSFEGTNENENLMPGNVDYIQYIQDCNNSRLFVKPSQISSNKHE